VDAQCVAGGEEVPFVEEEPLLVPADQEERVRDDERADEDQTGDGRGSIPPTRAGREKTVQVAWTGM
jgi:hypothetical protein